MYLVDCGVDGGSSDKLVVLAERNLLEDKKITLEIISLKLFPP